MDVKKTIPELCEYNDEQEWFEFRVNWFELISFLWYSKNDGTF